MASKSDIDNQLSLSLTTTSSKKSPSNRTIAQHNDLVRANYDFTLTEHRLFITMLARINRGDVEFRLNRIPISELFPESEHESPRSGSRYPQVRKAVKRLINQTIEVEIVNEKGVKSYTGIPLMAIAQYKEGSGYIIAQFNDYAKTYLLDLKGNFTSAQELTLMGFHSSYSHRLYWLLKSELYRKGTYEAQVPFLRQILCLQDSYPVFKDFRRNIIDVAQKEIDATDMAFEYTLVRIARAVKSVIFRQKTPNQTKVVEIDFPETVHVKLTEIGISLKSLQEIKLAYAQKKIDEPYIAFVLYYYQEVNKKGRLRSLAGAIYKALTINQLRKEFDLYQQQNIAPLYKAPLPKQVNKASAKIIPFEELEDGWKVLNRKGLTQYATFEDSLVDYVDNPMYRFEERDGKKYLIVCE